MGVRIENWKGLATALSPYVLPPGATVRQTNLQIKRPGELRQRAGMEAVYSAQDYLQVVGMHRVSNGIQSPDDLILCARLNGTQTFLRYQSINDPTQENSWSLGETTVFTTPSLASPSFAQDRFDRIYVFQGNGVTPFVLNKKTKRAIAAGLTAPTVAPGVTPSGNGYFIERVDVVTGGGSYWSAPPIVIAGGGARIRDARLKAIVQGGSIVAVDVIDGGSGYQTAPTLTIDESTVKGVGFRGYGVIGVDPGISGFEPVFTTVGTVSGAGATSITAVADASLIRVGARLSGSALAAGTTAGVVSGSTVPISPAATGSGTNIPITVNEGTASNSADASQSLAFDTSVTNPSVAYRVGFTGTVAGNVVSGITNTGNVMNRFVIGCYVSGGGFPNGTTVTAINVEARTITLSQPTALTGSQTMAAVLAAPATYDSATGGYVALIPLTPTTNATTGAATAGSGAAARVSFTQYVSTLANQISSITAQDSAWPVKYNTFFGTSADNLTRNADYFSNTDDFTVGPDGSTTALIDVPYAFRANNIDYFAALTPGLTWKFHSRIPIGQYETTSTTTVNGSSFTTTTRYTTYGDAYLLEFGQISYRYYTGSRAELESATDTADKWVWATAPVQVSAQGPYIDITLQPAKKTATTNYATYSGYSKPTVRVYLKYCPNSWLSSAADNLMNIGWRRTVGSIRPIEQANPVAAGADTAKGWWTSGASVAGVSQRPIVDFRVAGNSDSSGIAAGTCEVINGGGGMEAETFFAIQFDQVNAANPAYGAFAFGTTNAIAPGSVNNFAPASGNPLTVPADWNSLDKAIASPAYSNEANYVLNTARRNKAFSAQRVRFYFWANTIAPGQVGPVGQLTGSPSVEVTGSNYANGDRASFTLSHRSDLTNAPTWKNGLTYTFTARQITPPTTTTTIASVVISSAGLNYYGSPKLKYTGTGYGLQMDALVDGGRVTQVNVTAGGTGFTQSPLITSDSETAKVIPVMRPAMRGTYRCAYRYADWSLTEVTQVSLTCQSGSTTATVSNADLVEVGYMLESGNVDLMTKVVSKSGTTITLSKPATATSTVLCIVRDMSRPITYSNFSPIVDIDTTTYAAVPNPTTMVWSMQGVTPPSRTTVVEFFRTSGDQSLVFYRLEQYGRVVGNSVEIVGSDTMTDEDLFNPNRPWYAAIPVVLPNGGLNAYRFGVPRSDMAVCAAFGDRLWYGVSTSGENANSVFFSVYDEFESCPAENEISIQNNQKSTDSLTGLIPFATYLLCMQNSHCYGLSYNTEPETDASVQYMAHRGMLSQGCHDLFNDNLYVMDERGVYTMDRAGRVESLSDPIRNYFDNGLLDLTYRSKFFVKVDQRNSILRAFVVTKGSGATSPNMAFCYHVDLKTWWTESWPNGLTCAVDFRRSFLEPDQPIYGAVDGDIYRAGRLADYSYRAIRSVSVTNGGSGYTTPPAVRVASGQSGCGASFTPVVVNGKVEEILIDEPGFGYGTLVGNTLTTSVPLVIDAPASGTTATATATCDPLTISPQVYPEFSVYYAVKTGAMELTNDGNANTRDSLIDRSVSVVYRPTATSTNLHLREFFNNSTQPRVNVMQRDRGTGWIHDTTGAKTRLDMSSTRSALGTATGVAKAQFAGRNYSDMGGADRHVAVELSGPAVPSGTPVPSEVLLYSMEVNGVQAGGD